MRVALVGLAPGPNTNPEYPLWPAPAGSAGGRLYALSGLRMVDYLGTFERHNLLDRCPKPADLTAERLARAYAGLRPTLVGCPYVVLLGREVAEAFGLAEAELLTWHKVKLSLVAVLPHPSGRNRWYNTAENVARVRDFFKELASWAMGHDTAPHCSSRRGVTEMAAKKKAARKTKAARPGKPKPVREGTKRAKIITLMSRSGGATLADIKRATKWSTKTAREGIRLVRTYSGYNVVEKPDDTFKIVGAKRAAKPREAKAETAAAA